MICEELRDHYEIYAMGLAGPEGRAIRAHLETGCEVCAAEMRRARMITALLGSTAPQAAPSPALRGRILAAAEFEERLGG